MSRFHAIFVETGFFYDMAKKKDKNKEEIWNEYDSVIRNAMWPLSPVAYLFGRYLYDKIAGNPTEVNRALYSAVNPAGDPPELSLKGAGNAILDMAFTNAKLLTGDYNNMWYKRNDDNIGDRVAQAAWAKYNNLPYDESLIIDNGDGTYSLPESVTKKIRTERSEIEGAYKINKEKYDKIREGYRKRITSAIDNGNLEEIPVIQKERDNNDELKILEYAIDFDEHNLKGLESLEKNGYGVFNMFNTKDRNLRKDLNTDLNILNDFTIRKNDDGTYSYEDMYDFFPLFHFLSNGNTFKVKGKIKKAGGGEVKTVSEEERPDFLKWYYDVATKKGLSLNPYGKNHYYDYELFWKNEPELAKAMLEGDSDAHFTDRYKMPGHPTFSKESVYSNKEHEGGSWIKHNGVNYFIPSDFTKQYIERTNDYLYGTGEGFVDDRLDGEKQYMLLGVGDEVGKRTGTGFRGVPFRNPNMDWDAFTSRFHKMNRFGGGKERRVSTDNLEYLYDKLLEKGYTGNQIYTLMANAIEESGGDPKAGVDGTGYAGLFQESLQRYTQDERERDSKLSDKEVIDNTVDRIDRHIRKGDGFLYYKGGFDNREKAQEVFLDDDSSLEDVMRSFVYNFERTADPQGTYINRVNTARIIRDMVESNDKPEILSVPKVAVYDEGGYVASSDNTSVATGYREPLSSFGTFIPYEGGVLPEVNVYGKLTEQALRRAQARRGRNYVYQGQREVAEPIINTVSAVGGFFPVVGEGMDAIDLYNALKSGDYEGVGLAAFGFIPGLGTFRDVQRAHEATQYYRRTLNFVDSPYRKYERPSKLTYNELRGIGRSNKPQQGAIRNREEFEKDLEALDQFAYKYGYNFNRENIRTQSELDEAYRNIIAQHNTFVRGVRADSYKEAMRNMHPTTDLVGAGRYGWSNRDLPTTYVSNSYDTGMGYATGKGYTPEKQNGWIGRIRVNVDFDPSVPRREWLNKNNFAYTADNEYIDHLIPDDVRYPIEGMIKRIKSEAERDFFMHTSRISKEDLLDLMKKDDGYSDYVNDYFRSILHLWNENPIDKVSEMNKKTFRIPTLETYVNNRDRIKFIDDYVKKNPDLPEILRNSYPIDVSNSVDPYIAYLYYADRYESRLLSEDEFRKATERLRLADEARGIPTYSKESSIYAGTEIRQPDNYMHYILTDPKSYSVTGLQNVGSVDWHDYTRRHYGSVGEDLSRKSFEEGGEHDIRNYYASRDNTSVGAPGYDLNAGNIKPSQSFDMTETIASFLPGVGDVVDAKDLMESARDKDVMGMALALAGFIPVAGDAAQEYFRLIRESRGLDREKRFIRNDIKETDDELLEKMPSYAHPNSPMADAMVFHKMRLDNDGYNKVVGGYTPGLDYRMRDLNQVYPGIYDKAFDVDYVFDPNSKETRALVGITYGLSDDVVKKMSDEEIMSHVNRLQFKLNANNPMFNIGNKGDRATVYSSSGFEQRFPFGGDDALNAAKSHELEHAVRNNAETPVTKEMADEAKEWFSFSSGNELYDEYMNNPLELLARGSQIKDYFGLTNSKQEVTPEMLKYFSRHYAFDVFDNDMTNFVKGIKDWDKAAKWISEYPTVYGGAAIVSKALEEGDNEVREMDGSLEMETGGVVFPNDDYSMSNNGLYRPLLYPYMISKRKRFIKNLMKSKYGISEQDSEQITDNLAKKTLLDSGYYDFKNKEYGIASLKGNDLKEFVSTYKNGGLIDQVDFIAKKFKRGDYRQFMEPGGLVEKQDKLIETLTTDYGIPDLQAVAIVANLTHESNLDPYITGDSGDSYGIQQWRDARRMALWDFARNRYHAVPTYEDQIAFLMDEFNHGKSFQFEDKGKNLYQSGAVKDPTFDYYQYSKNDFMNASNLYDAVIAWNQGAGRPSKKYAMNDRRFEIAKEIAERNGIEYDPVSHYSEMGYRSVGNEDITVLEQAVEENPAAAEVVAETSFVADREDGVPPAGATQKERENWLISHYEDAILQQAVSSDGLRNKMDRMDKDISALKDQIESDEQKESEAIKESEQKRREREFLASVLSNVQLNIKGVSQIGRS